MRTVVFNVLCVPVIHYTFAIGGTFIYFFSSHANNGLKGMGEKVAWVGNGLKSFKEGI